MQCSSLKTGCLKLLSQLPEGLQQAGRTAVSAHQRSYCPYSNFAVGAALLHDDGKVTSGCNYETCVYKGTCAEACAIVKANMDGYRTAQAVAIYGRSVLPTAAAAAADATVPPCGFCRQLLAEVADLSGNMNDFLVVLVTFDQEHARLFRLSELLPQPFGPSSIGMDVAALATGEHSRCPGTF
ncbi:cytidine deaminase, putative [Trypanosoma brucei brucei TREU927]|uniref:Cytidine deaminase, putative n=3 Tax=Trypanosoma brucei TaxID=5691 RepID=Q38FM3_TRYB2|nr:cytidine deaminase, putative [Trypanosoma brucei brucei TREU927]EAN76397.1 cytidine deaminase, putative [Trypanosoma brucei brucei TREU927]RHW70619.1 cytidine deaminase [Trypanosoma brucei equiperdum]